MDGVSWGVPEPPKDGAKERREKHQNKKENLPVLGRMNERRMMNEFSARAAPVPQSPAPPILEDLHPVRH